MNFREWIELSESSSMSRQRGAGYAPEAGMYGSRNSDVNGLTKMQGKLKDPAGYTELVSTSMPGNEPWVHSVNNDRTSDVVAILHQKPRLENIDKAALEAIPTFWGKPSSPLPDKPWWQDNLKNYSSAK